MDLNFVDRLVDGVGFGGGVEEGEALAVELLVADVFVGAAREFGDADDFAAEQHVIAGVDVVPVGDADTGRGGVVVAEGGEGLDHGADGGDFDGFTVGGEDFEGRVEIGAEAAGHDFKDQGLALFGLEGELVDGGGFRELAVEGDGEGECGGGLRNGEFGVAAEGELDAVVGAFRAELGGEGVFRERRSFELDGGGDVVAGELDGGDGVAPEAEREDLRNEAKLADLDAVLVGGAAGAFVVGDAEVVDAGPGEFMNKI